MLGPGTNHIRAWSPGKEHWSTSILCHQTQFSTDLVREVHGIDGFIDFKNFSFTERFVASRSTPLEFEGVSPGEKS
jgi:hypothetical protein